MPSRQPQRQYRRHLEDDFTLNLRVEPVDADFRGRVDYENENQSAPTKQAIQAMKVLGMIVCIPTKPHFDELIFLDSKQYFEILHCSERNSGFQPHT